MNDNTSMKWTGYLMSIGGLLILLLMSDRPGWIWPAGGVVMIACGLVLVYRARRRRRDEDGLIDDGASVVDDLFNIVDAD